ncbi:MAG: hypothetical protein ACRCSN_08450 [Dermatophilaceae bacterium]
MSTATTRRASRYVRFCRALDRVPMDMVCWIVTLAAVAFVLLLAVQEATFLPAWIPAIPAEVTTAR